MKTKAAPFLPCCAFLLAISLQTCPGYGRSLSVAGNTANFGYDPITGGIYTEMRSGLTAEFPGTTFTSLPTLTGSLSGYDMIVLNRFQSADLQPAEQANIYNYVLHGGNLLYVGEAAGGVSNDTYTMPFNIAMLPDPTTDPAQNGGITSVTATYTNPGHPFLNGPFGAPPNQPTGSVAAKITVLGPSVTLAQWDPVSGGVAISAFESDTLGPGAGFGIFLTDVDMMTPNRYLTEVGPMVANAIAIPEPSAAACLGLGALAAVARRRRHSRRQAALSDPDRFRGEASV